MLPTRPIGKTGLFATELAFGAASIGNLGRQISEKTAHLAVRAAFDGGVRLFDTAPYYGRGLSERRLGDALRGLRTTDVVVSTKVGRLLLPEAEAATVGEIDGFWSDMPFRVAYDYSHDGILRSFEASLHRLGLDRIDLLFVHDIGARIHGSDNAHYWHQLTRGGGFDALTRLREQRSIGGFGLGVNEVEVCIDAIDAASIDVLLLANRHTLLDHGALDRLLPLCLTSGISVIAGAPYNSGILATGTHGDKQPHYDYAPAPEAIIARVRQIEAVANHWNIPLAAAALHYVLLHPAVCAVLPGISDARRMERTLALHSEPVPAKFWQELVALGLIPPLIGSDNLENAKVEGACK